MTARDWRAATGCAMGITGLLLLAHDLWTGWHQPRRRGEGGQDRYGVTLRDPLVTLFLSPFANRYVGRRG